MESMTYLYLCTKAVAGWEQQQILLALMIPLVTMVDVQTADPLGVRVF